MKDENDNCQGQVVWYNTKHRSGICMLPGEVLEGYICIARAAVNVKVYVCEASHAEHVQFATAAVSTRFRTYVAEVIL